MPRLVALAVAIAAVAAAVLLRRRRRATAQQQPGHADWTCECGQGYRLSGAGRHRVFWLDGDAVVDGRCPSCGRELGQESDVAAPALA